MTGLLITFTLILIIIVLFQVTKTLDLVGELKGEKDGEDEQAATINGVLFILFFFFIIGMYYFCVVRFEDLLPVAASEHALLINKLFKTTLYITSIVFVITNAILFLFSFVYRYKEGRKAYHFSHSNKLELIWTVIPAIVLTTLVIMGLQVWYKIMGPAKEDPIVFEMTGQQFFWTSRFPGADGELGPRNYNLISAQNPLGLVTPEFAEHKVAELEKALVQFEIREQELPVEIDAISTLIKKSSNPYQVDSAKVVYKGLLKELDEIPDKIENRIQTMERIQEKFNDEYFQKNADKVSKAYDDFLPSEIHIPVNKEALVRISAIDVLHNFYLPNFSVKMDAVPGMPTQFKFVPTKTTAEMRDILSGNPVWQEVDPDTEKPRYTNFNYEVACAELCGTGHSSMRYVMVVESEAEYGTWMAAQQPYFDQIGESLLKRQDPPPYIKSLENRHKKGHHGEEDHGEGQGEDHHAKAEITAGN